MASSLKITVPALWDAENNFLDNAIYSVDVQSEVVGVVPKPAQVYPPAATPTLTDTLQVNTVEHGTLFLSISRDAWMVLIREAEAGGSSSGGGGLTIGNAVSGGAANAVLYEDASQNLAASSGFTWNGSTLVVQGSGGGSAIAFRSNGAAEITATSSGTIMALVVGTETAMTLSSSDNKVTIDPAYAIVGATTTQTAGDNSTQLASTAYADSAGVYTRQTSLSSAQILALNSTPIELVTAPGAGKIIVPLSIIFDYTFVTTAYATNTTVSIYENADKSNPTWPCGLNFNLTSSQIRDTYKAVAANGGTIVQFADNQPLMIYVTGGNPTTGDGTAKITVLYKIVTR